MYEQSLEDIIWVKLNLCLPPMEFQKKFGSPRTKDEMSKTLKWPTMIITCLTTLAQFVHTRHIKQTIQYPCLNSKLSVLCPKEYKSCNLGLCKKYFEWYANKILLQSLGQIYLTA